MFVAFKFSYFHWYTYPSCWFMHILLPDTDIGLSHWYIWKMVLGWYGNVGTSPSHKGSSIGTNWNRINRILHEKANDSLRVTELKWSWNDHKEIYLQSKLLKINIFLLNTLNNWEASLACDDHCLLNYISHVWQMSSCKLIHTSGNGSSVRIW